jgi:hypothetical protein
MTRKEFIESVRLRRSLREWATTQPGYVPPVTAADVETVMAKLRPQFKPVKSPKRVSLNELIKLQSAISYKVKKTGKAKPKLRILPKATKANREEIESNLLKEKLLQIEGGVKILTAKGKRFVTEFERSHKAQA